MTNLESTNALLGGQGAAQTQSDIDWLTNLTQGYTFIDPITKDKIQY